MKSTFCVIFAATFLSFHGISKAIDPIDEAEKQVPTEWRSNYSKLKFSDLNEDCLIIILELSSLDVLINVAELDQKHYLMANLAFKRKFANHQITIKNNFSLPETPKVQSSLAVSSVLQWIGLGRTKKTIKRKPKRSRSEYIEFDSSIEIHDYATIERTFKHFGRFISKLKVIYVENHQPQAEFMGKLITDHCSESLVEVQFDVCTEKTLEYITRPLVNAKSVTFGVKFTDSGNKSLPLNELFPAVENLHLDGWFATINYIDVHVPHLNHLFIQINGRYLWNDLAHLPNLGKVLRKNTQIQSIELKIIPKASTLLIQSVNELLPNISSLALWEFRLDREIRFENVTTFTAMSFSPPNNLYFPNLDNLHLRYDYDDDEIYDFLEQHSNVSTLHLKVDEFILRNGRLSLIDLRRYTNRLPNLRELSVWTLKNFIHYANIESCLKTHDTLMQFQLIVDDEPEFKEEIRRRLEARGLDGEWDIIDIHKGLLFQRKEQ